MSLRSLLNGHHELYYMAPMHNAPFIAALGIYPYNSIQSRADISNLLVSIADPAVNFRRHGITFEGNRLHDYVPLYWAKHTPMQYVITVRDGKLPQDDLVFFCFDAEEVLGLQGIWTTDGNAASSETGFWPGIGALTSIDWRIVDTPNAYSREYKRKKAAEVLVPYGLSPKHISRICVRSQGAADRLRIAVSRAAGDVGVDLPPIQVQPFFYY